MQADGASEYDLILRDRTIDSVMLEEELRLQLCHIKLAGSNAHIAVVYVSRLLPSHLSIETNKARRSHLSFASGPLRLHRSPDSIRSATHLEEPSP